MVKYLQTNILLILRKYLLAIHSIFYKAKPRQRSSGFCQIKFSKFTEFPQSICWYEWNEHFLFFIFVYDFKSELGSTTTWIKIALFFPRISGEMWNNYMMLTVILQYVGPLIVISITYGLIAKVNDLVKSQFRRIHLNNKL